MLVPPLRPVFRYTYEDCYRRSKQLARALGKLGVEKGDRVGTVAWNTHRHLELYYGVSGMGAILHTINPRLFAQQIIYIGNHAEVRALLLLLSPVGGCEAVFDRLRVPRRTSTSLWT